MSETNSEISVEIIKPKFSGYYCQKCEYKTKKLKSFINHVTRKIPCDTIKDFNYGIIKANEKYEKRSQEVLDMLDRLESGEEVNMKKLNKYVDEVSRLGRVYPTFNPNDIQEIKSIINTIK